MKPLPPIELPGGCTIGGGRPCFIVAEIGQNHNGDAYTATRLMKAADDAGVDAVKFCKRHVPSDLTAAAYREPYHGPQSFGPVYGKHREALELSIDEYRHLKQRAEYNRWPAVFFATACDHRSVDELESAIDPPLYKVASRDLTNLPLVEYIARLRKPIVLSTGMCSTPSLMDEVGAALDVVRRYHNQIVVLLCTSAYPTDYEHVNLPAMMAIRREHEVLVGVSDHTIGIMVPVAAVALGAVMVEKHLTLARAMKGTDHACSLEPDGLRRVVRDIRNAEAALRPCGDEASREAALADARARLGRSLVSARAIRKGETLTESMLCLKSPGTGLSWHERSQLIGRIARRDIPADVTLQPSDVSSHKSDGETRVTGGRSSC